MMIFFDTFLVILFNRIELTTTIYINTSPFIYPSNGKERTPYEKLRAIRTEITRELPYPQREEITTGSLPRSSHWYRRLYEIFPEAAKTTEKNTTLSG